MRSQTGFETVSNWHVSKAVSKRLQKDTGIGHVPKRFRRGLIGEETEKSWGNLFKRGDEEEWWRQRWRRG